MPWVAAASLVVAAATATMQLHSPDFSPGGVIPQRAMAADCGGENRSPELTWSAVPEGVKSFALILHDPDAPLAGGFYHWVVYNIPADARRLAGGATLTSGQLGTSTRGTVGYYGPCPPPGQVHHYVFTLYALDLPHVAASSPMTASLLEARIAGHVLARAILTGTESHH